MSASVTRPSQLFGSWLAAIVGPAAGSKVGCALGVLEVCAPGKEPAAVVPDVPFFAEPPPLPPPHAVSASAAEQATPSAAMRVRVRRAGAGAEAWAEACAGAGA